MNEESIWRAMSPEEAMVIREIVSASDVQGGEGLIGALDDALVAHSTTWILDVKVPTSAVGSDLPDGPFPARAFVPSNVAYQGEVIIWLTNGSLSGLEYAWITDEPPTRWPRPDEMEVVRQTGEQR